MSRRRKKFKSLELIIGILVVSIFCFETIGYATYNRLLVLSGVVTIKPDGKLEVKSAVVSSTSNASSSEIVYDGTNLNFNINYNVKKVDSVYEAKYAVIFENNSSYNFVFTDSNFNYTLEKNDGSIVEYEFEGISIGEVINSKESRTLNLTIRLTPKAKNSTYNLSVQIENLFDINTDGSLLVSLGDNKTGDLRNSNIAKFSFDVINGYEYNKNINLSINSNNFILCDANGNNLSTYVVGPGEYKTLDFYIKLKDNATLSSDVEKLTILYSYDDKIESLGILTLNVNKNYIDDTEAPIISNVVASKNSELNSVHVTWNGYDDTSVNHYIVKAYNTSNVQIGSDFRTNADETFIDIKLNDSGSNIDGTYYFKVYGVDNSLPVSNTATQTEINNATTSSGHCSRSSNISLKWYANVSYTGSFTSGTVKSVLIGSTLTTSITGSSSNRPVVSSITMNGTRTSNYQTSGTSTLTITIPNVTGDVVINTSSQGSCLIKGTKVLLYNNEYKNIEDITYQDLLAVYDYDRGVITYEYPIWIEKEAKTSYYQLNTFSDGSVLKTVGYHGIYNKDLNKFVSVDNDLEFNIGSTILKLKNNKLKEVTVTNIEYVEEEVTYYHVVSSRYYNIIANDFITTDGTTALSNIYKYDENLKWNRKENEGYSYSKFEDIVPYYMYYAMRMQDSIYLSDYGLDLNTFRYYLLNNQLNKNLMLELPKVNNKLIYTVSIDNISYCVLENEYITIPGDNNIYLNTLDNKIYKSKDKMKVIYSSYLKRIN